MAVGVNALTTWVRVKASLGFTSDDNQVAVEFLIDAVSSMANRISGRLLKARAYTDLRVDGSGTDTLILPDFPIAASPAIKIYVDNSRVFGAETELASTSYKILADTGMIRLYSGVFSQGIGNIKIVGTLGYSTIPEDLELAAVQCVGYNRRQLESGTTGMRQVSQEGTITSQYELGLPQSIREVFESYRSRLP